MAEEFDYGTPLKGINRAEGMERELGNQGYVETPNPPRRSFAQEMQRQNLETSPMQEIGFAGLNDTHLDEQITSATELDNLSDTRGRLQPWYEQLAYGTGKALVLTGTTFLNGTVGNVLGALNAIDKQKWSGLWDNDFGKAMEAVNQWSEKAMPNYMTDQEIQNDESGEWYKNIFTTNWIGDKFIKNLGFTAGAAAAGAVVSIPLGGIPSGIKSFVGAGISAFGEGKIEALNNATQWEEAVTAEIQEKTAQQLALIAPYKGTPQYEELEAPIRDAYNQTIAKIQEDKAKMGNVDLLLNMPILLTSNTIQFAKLYSGGYKTARKSVSIALRDGKYVSTLSKARPFLNPLSEGAEEIEQEVANVVPGHKYRTDINSFYSSKLNPEAEEETMNWLKASAEGIAQVAETPSTWEQGFIGALTGALGMPRFRSRTDANGNPQSPITIEGGLIGGFKEYREDLARDTELINRLNDRLASPEFLNYYQGLIRHNKYQNDMDEAAINGDEFEFKNAEHSQFISDIAMFDNASKLNDLKDWIEQAYDTSEENIASVVKNTTDEQGNGPFIENGNQLSNEQIAEKLTKAKDEMLSQIDEYKRIKDNIDIKSGEQLSNEELEELTWIATQSEDWNKRFNSLADEVKEVLNTNAAEIEHKLNSDGINTEVVEQLRALTSMSNPVMQALLANSSKKFLSEMAELRKAIENSYVLDKFDLLQKLEDLDKLAKARKQFNEKYNEYTKNPEGLVDSIQQAINTAVENQAKKIVEDSTSKVNTASNIKEFKEAIKDIDPEILPKVFDNIRKGSNLALKDLLRDYESLDKMSSEISKLLPDDNSPESESIRNIVQDALDNGTSAASAQGIIQDAIKEVGEDVGKGLKELLDEYNRIQESGKVDKPDNNVPEKPLKKKKKENKKKKGFSLSEASDENAPDAEQLESNKGEEQPAKPVKTPENSAEKLIDGLKKKPLNELKEIASGKEDLSKGKESAEPSVKKLAQKIHNDKILPPAHENGEGTNSETNSEPKRNTGVGYLRSWTETKYDFNELKDRTLRRKVQRNNPVVQALDELGAYEFVDNGSLGELFNRNKDLPIHYVVHPDPRLASKGIILLAIEVTPEVYQTVKPINPFRDSEGKLYQAVGSLGFDAGNKQSMSNYNRIIDGIADETEEVSSEIPFVSKKFSNKIKHIYSGRMVKSSETEGPRKRSLNRAFMNGETPKFGIYYNDTTFKTPGIDEYEEVVPINTNNANPREGSVWLMTKEADGRYYAKAIQMRRFNAEEYDINEHKNSPILDRIVEDLMTVADSSKSDYERSLAKYDLEEVLYFPEGTSILFNGDSVSITGYQSNIAEGQDAQSKAAALLTALQDDELNLRFQIIPSELTSSQYVQDILDSDIMTTDLLQPGNVNASFDMFINDLETGEPIPDETHESPKGHTGKKGINNALTGSTIMYGGDRFILKEDGTVYKGTEQITDQNTIDEIKFMNDIKNKTVKPVDGSRTLYLGAYSNGEEYGVVNYKVKKGKELEDLKKKAAKNVAKRSKKDTMDSIFEATTEDDIRKLLGEEAAKEAAKESEGEFFEGVEDADAALAKILGIEPEAPKKEKPKPTPIIPEPKSSVPSLGESFNPAQTKSAKELQISSVSQDFNKLVRANRNAMKELGFKNVSELMEYINDPNNHLPDINSITTQEAFDSLVDTIKNCR